MSNLPDIDIDFANREHVLKLFKHIPASIVKDNTFTKHNTGVYFHEIPVNPYSNTASIDYKTAEDREYFKIDLLNVSVYQLVKDHKHLQQLLDIDPPWHRLWEEKEFCEKIVHIGNYYNTICEMKPNSIERMAAFISIIRPGKAHLQGKTWHEVFADVWNGDTSHGYTFKKSHAIGYAHLVKVHMNLVDSLD